jgi:hypothetical protein
MFYRALADVFRSHSDTHILTLPFIGELCLCALRASHPTSASLQQFGRDALQLYIEACHGPLKEHGWASEEAAANLRLLT